MSSLAVEAFDRRGGAEDPWVATLAHELRNALGAITLALDAMQPACAADPDAREARDIAEHSSQHMERIIEDVLDICRGSHGKLVLRAERVDLAQVITSAARSVRPLVLARKHRLAVRLPPGPVLLTGDATRLEQVITNLLTNAAKFTEPGGHIDLIVARTAPGWVIRVSDDGIGIAPDALPHVFDLYSQGGVTPGGRGGLGIGLALVRSLVELHGGTIYAYSDGPGAGAQFTVILPFAAAQRCLA